MLWLSIILSILQAIPGIMTLVKQIVDQLHGHPLQPAKEAELMGLVSKWNTTKDNAQLEADLTTFGASL